MTDHKTILDTDYEEYIWMQEHPPKSPQTCASCRYSLCLDTDEDCDFCTMWDKTARRCRCASVEEDKNCPYYERRESC